MGTRQDKKAKFPALVFDGFDRDRVIAVDLHAAHPGRRLDQLKRGAIVPERQVPAVLDIVNTANVNANDVRLRGDGPHNGREVAGDRAGYVVNDNVPVVRMLKITLQRARGVETLEQRVVGKSGLQIPRKLPMPPLTHYPSVAKAVEESCTT